MSKSRETAGEGAGKAAPLPCREPPVRRAGPGRAGARCAARGAGESGGREAKGMARAGAGAAGQAGRRSRGSPAGRSRGGGAREVCQRGPWLRGKVYGGTGRGRDGDGYGTQPGRLRPGNPATEWKWSFPRAPAANKRGASVCPPPPHPQTVPRVVFVGSPLCVWPCGAGGCPAARGWGRVCEACPAGRLFGDPRAAAGGSPPSTPALLRGWSWRHEEEAPDLRSSVSMGRRLCKFSPPVREGLLLLFFKNREEATKTRCEYRGIWRLMFEWARWEHTERLLAGRNRY